MASANKITIVLGAAFTLPQSVNFEDVTAFSFGTISEVVQFVPTYTEPSTGSSLTTSTGGSSTTSTGGSSATIKPTSRGKRPNVVIPNPSKVWRRKGSSTNEEVKSTPTKLTTCPAEIKSHKLSTTVNTTPSIEGRVNLQPALKKKEMQPQKVVMSGGRTSTSLQQIQARTTVLAPHNDDEERSVILIAGNTPAARIFSNPEKMRKRERQQERKKKARQNKGQCPKLKSQAWPTKFTLADDNLFNLLRLIKRNTYSTRGLQLKTDPSKQVDLHTPNQEAHKKSILKNAYDIYKAAKKSTTSQKVLMTKINKSQSPSRMPRRRSKENYEIHTVRMVGASDPPPTHEAVQTRDKIVTRSQSSRTTSTPRKDSLSIAAEESTSAPRNLPPAREEEPEATPQTQNAPETTGIDTNQLLLTIMNQMQTLSTQLNDTNQRVTNLQDYIYRQEEPPTLLNLAVQPSKVPPASHHQSSSAMPLGVPNSMKAQDNPLFQQSIRQAQPIPQQSSSLTNPPKERDGYMTKEEVQQLITNQLKQGEIGVTRRMGRPYPAGYDMVPYPIGYTVPKFKSFNGIGNPI